MSGLKNILKNGKKMAKNLDYDKLLTRLTTILQKLYDGEELSVSELAIEFNVSTKTIQRDFNERLIRFPIEKVGRKWKMMEGRSIEKKRTPQEELILHLLGEIARGIGEKFGEKTSSLFSKITDIDKNPIYSKIAIEDVSEIGELFGKLESAIKQNQEVEFSYKGKNRTIRAYKIVSFEGYWYLYGEDLFDNKIKTFHLKGISNLVITSRNFEQKSEIIKKLELSINAWFEPDSKPFLVRLLAKKEIVKYLKRRPLSASSKITEERSNGDIIIELYVTSNKEIIHEVKKYMPALLPLSPSSLLTEARDMAGKFVERIDARQET